MIDDNYDDALDNDGDRIGENDFFDDWQEAEDQTDEQL